MAEDNRDDSLHIFVNRRKFGAADGVKPEMTGAEIAALVSVPPNLAVVKREPGQQEIGVDEKIHIHNGEHFLVTRRVVEGGHVS